MRQYFLSRNGNIPPLTLLEGYYLLRVSYETGIVKKRTRKEKILLKTPSISQGLWEKLYEFILVYKLKSQQWKAVPGGPAQSQPCQPVCQVADSENGDKHKCPTNSSHLHQHPTTDRASEIGYKI